MIKKKKSKLILGIDPGKSGGLVLLSAKTGKIVKKKVMPLVGKELLDTDAIDSFVKKYAHRIEHVFMEKVAAMPFQGVVSMFSFGVVFGVLQGVVVGNSLPHTLVMPKAWQQRMFLGVPHVSKSAQKGKGKKKQKVNDNKAMALIAAKRLFPKTSFIPAGCRKEHDGLVDAALIALWGYWQLKGNRDATKSKRKN